MRALLRGAGSVAVWVVAASAVGGTAGEKPRTPDLARTYSDRERGYRISYPENWTCELREGQLALSGPEGSPAWFTHLGVAVAATASGGGEHKDADALMAHLRGKLAAGGREASFGPVRRSPYDLDGVTVEARLMLAAYKRPDRDLAMRTLVLLLTAPDGGRVYALTYTAPLAWKGRAIYEPCLPTASAIMNSFRLTGAAPGGAQEALTATASRPKPPPPLRVVTAEGKPARGAGAVVLAGERALVEIGCDGLVSFDELPPGRYVATTLWSGYRKVRQMLIIRTGEAPIIRLPDAAEAPAAIGEGLARPGDRSREGSP